jgi:hypothetical protein
MEVDITFRTSGGGLQKVPRRFWKDIKCSFKLGCRITLNSDESANICYLYRCVMKKDIQNGDSTSASSMSTSHDGCLRDAASSPRIWGQIALRPRNWRLLKRRTCIACGCQPFMILPQTRISTHQTVSSSSLVRIDISGHYRRSFLLAALALSPDSAFSLHCPVLQINLSNCELAISAAY